MDFSLNDPLFLTVPVEPPRLQTGTGVCVNVDGLTDIAESVGLLRSQGGKTDLPAYKESGWEAVTTTPRIAKIVT